MIGDVQIPNSISPVDNAIGEARRIVRAKGLVEWCYAKHLEYKYLILKAMIHCKSKISIIREFSVEKYTTHGCMEYLHSTASVTCQWTLETTVLS